VLLILYAIYGYLCFNFRFRIPAKYIGDKNMANWALITYTRESTDKAWYEPSDTIKDKVVEYQNTDPKKIVHYETAESANGLKKYFKIGFLDSDTALAFGNTDEMISSREQRDNFCNNADNGVTYSIDRALEVEPSIPA
jgi:hypothetical protein|tara:strand:+ start:1576 stop:1992 length:417 start_codon:yes stop_codon:yes gene_type:complete